MTSFERGKTYSRQQIQAVLGGGLQDYLPHVGGVVVAGCFNKEYNPDAPTVILPGEGVEIEKWGRVFAAQTHAIPVFVKKRSNEWHCFGSFKCSRLSDDPATIAEHAKRAGRDNVTMVLFLERQRD